MSKSDMLWAYRSRGDPWPHVQSGEPGGHNATTCPGSPEPQCSQGAGSHYAQSVPIAYVNACS